MQEKRGNKNPFSCILYCISVFSKPRAACPVLHTIPLSVKKLVQAIYPGLIPKIHEGTIP